MSYFYSIFFEETFFTFYVRNMMSWLRLYTEHVVFSLTLAYNLSRQADPTLCISNQIFSALPNRNTIYISMWGEIHHRGIGGMIIMANKLWPIQANGLRRTGRWSKRNRYLLSCGSTIRLEYFYSHLHHTVFDIPIKYKLIFILTQDSPLIRPWLSFQIIRCQFI